MADSKEAKKAKQQELKAAKKEETKNLSICFQYVSGIIVVIGGFVAGTAIGWSSPAASILKRDVNVEDYDFAWISSTLALGAAISQFLVVVMVRYIGLKWTLVTTYIVLLLGWVPLTITNNVIWLIVGRLICGMIGCFCVACPMFIAETTHKYHRGTVSVFFQLFITGGILFAYVMGSFKNMVLLNIACGSGCIVGIVFTVLFIPESPYSVLKKGKHEKFEKIMRKYRGKNFDYSKEESEMQAAINSKASVKEGFKKVGNLKAFGVLLGLHVFQQLTGINAILYHAHAIFAASNTGISEDLSVIVVGIAQVVFCLVAAALVDRAGRILLFTISLGTMCVCLAATGIYFNQPEDTQEVIGVLPTIALVLYISGFSLGTGPLPWVMLGEYLPNDVKALMSTIIAFVNWMLAFALAWLMPIMMINIYPAYIFYGFAIICFIGICYTLLFVVETNGKTFEEIQSDIENHKPGALCRKQNN